MKLGNAFLSTQGYEQLIKTISPRRFLSPSFQFGSISREDIEKHMRENKRIINIPYPHFKTGKKSKNPYFFHTMFDITKCFVALHDIYHILVSSNKDLKLAFDMVDSLRGYFVPLDRRNG